MAAMHFKKLASQKADFKKAFIRGCTDRLREIEARLDYGCSGVWLREVDRCDDLQTIARLLRRLQRRTPVGKVDNTWLEELQGLDAAAVEEQQAELSRRLMHRLEEVDRSVPTARPPAEMLGETVLKYFDGHGAFMGTIIEYDEATGFRLQARTCLGAIPAPPSTSSSHRAPCTPHRTRRPPATLSRPSAPRAFDRANRAWCAAVRRRVHGGRDAA